MACVRVSDRSLSSEFLWIVSVIPMLFFAPSGSKPWSSGCRRIMKAIGIMTMATNTARVMYPPRHPDQATTAVMARGVIKPPKDTPVDPIASAQPRFCMNHLLNVELTTCGPKNDQPSSPFNTHKDQNSHNEDCKDNPQKQREQTVPPNSKRGLGPFRSNIGPAIIPESAPTAVPSDAPRVNCHICQPISSTTGLMSTPTTT